MKKKSVLMMLIFSVASLFLLTSCGPATSMHASFLKSEYAVSLGQTVNFLNELTLENISAEKIDITFSDNDLFGKSDSGQFVAQKSGTTNVYAQTEGNVLATAKVIVKEKFTAPTEFHLDSNGLLTWETPTAYVDGRVVAATEFVLMINGEENRITKNEFLLPEKGAYAIQINVLGTQYVDASGFSGIQNVYFGLMEPAKIERFNVSTVPGNHEVEISWSITANANYNVRVDGIELLSNYSFNSTTISFKNYASGRSIHLEIETLDTTGRNLPVTATFEVVKLNKPQINYTNTDVSGGVLSWSSIENAAGYIIHYLNRANPGIEDSILIRDPAVTQTTLPNVAAGIYDVSVQALGQKNENVFYVNSNEENVDVAKLKKPDFDYIVNQQQLQITFAQDSYIENYVIAYAGNILQWNTKINGYKATIDCSALEAGQIDFEVYAYPTILENGNVKPYSESGFNTANVINSDANVFSIYKLANIQELNHQLTDTGSELSFDAVKYADTYTVTVNNTPIENPTLSSRDGKVYLELGDLSLISPLQGKYNLQVTATRKDGQAIDILGQKELTILSVVTPLETQENGSFAWNAVENASYYYEIYSVPADYITGDNLGTPSITGETTSPEIDSVLPFGYYVIRVFTKTTDDNQFLDADFYDSTKVLEQSFHVNEQIETPEVTFEYSEARAAYIAKINTVDYAGKYEIYVDGEYENSLFSDGSVPTLTYIFQNKFNIAKTYEVTVIAKAGDDFDSILHTDSQAAVCSVKRLGIPTFTVDDTEVLSVNMDEDAYRVIIRYGATPINGEGETSASLANFTGEFNIYLQFFAKVSENNQYYLDGAEGTVAFKRTSIPTNIQYQNGNLTYDCVDDASVEKYIITVTLVNPDNGNYTVTTEAHSLNYDLQAYIQQMCNNEKFNSFYSQSSAIEVRVSAYRLGFVDDVYFLPSGNGTTTLGAEFLTLTKLAAPIVTFDTDTMELSYTAVGSVGTTSYTIYADGEAIVDDYTGTVYSLESLDFLNAKTVKVFANNAAYLSSANSNQIVIRQLKSIDQIGVHPVSSVDAGIVESLYFSVPTIDLSHVTKVLCNGAPVAFNNVNGYTQLNIADFESDASVAISIALQAKAAETISGVTYYYIDSESRSYQLEDMAKYAITLQINAGVLSWNDIAEDWVGIENRPLTYTLSVYKNGTFLKSKTGITENTYSMDDAFLLGLTSSEYTLVVTAVLQDYAISSTKIAPAKAYYGSLSSLPFAVQKLLAVSETTYSYQEDESIILETERKAKAGLLLAWKNKWEGVSEVAFNLVINAGTPKETIISGIKNGSASELFNCNYDSNTKFYTLLLNESYFQVGKNTLQFTVYATGAITSDPFEIEFNRYDTVPSLSINDAGELNIEDTVAENKMFQIAVTIGGNTYYQTTADVKVDILTNLLDQASGNYAVQVVAFDATGKVMSSPAVTEIRGYRLQGIQSAEIQPTGDVSFTLFSESEAESNITFVARYRDNYQVFIPSVQEDGSYLFAMIDFITLFGITENGLVQLEVSVQKTGNINADWVSVTFLYEIEAANHITFARGRNMADDYFKINEIAGTKSFRYKLSFNDILGNPVQDEQIYTAAQLAGYWVTTQEGSYFAPELPSGVLNFESCYGMSLNELVKNIASGAIEIQISRVAYNGTHYVQYNQIIKNYKKLETVEGLTLKGNRLTWTLSPETETSGYYVYFYTQDIKDYVLFTYRHVTTAYLDLSLTDFISLTPGIRYYVNVVSVSAALGNIASDPTNMLSVYKYKQPESVEVKNGKIQINETAFQNSKILKDIQTYYNSADFLKNIATTTYEDLFQFTAASLPTMRIMLQFSRGSATYTATIAAVDLLPDFNDTAYQFQQPGMTSPITLLQAIENELKRESSHNVYWNDVYALYQALIQSNHGISDYNTLFDDFGAQIPGGTYAVSMRQLGISGAGTIDSEYSAANEMYVMSAPALSLNVEKTDNRNYYKVGFSTVQLASKTGDVISNSTAGSYLLRMIGQNKDGSLTGIRYYFNIINVGDADNPKYVIPSYAIPVYSTVIVGGNEHQIESLQTTYFDSPIVLDYNAGTKYVTLDITRKLLTTFPEIERQTYQFSIYANGNDYSVNSKTDTVQITLLGFNYQSVTLTDGVIYWNATDSISNYKTRVVYKTAATEPSSEEIAFEDTAFGENVGVLTLQYDGIYDYIVFTILGSIGQASMSVDSESYMIENIYKMTAPKMQANNNLLEILGSSRNNDFYQTVQFKIRNDVSLQQDPALNYTTDKMKDVTTYAYTPGKQGTENEYKTTENEATEFYAMSIGMTVPAAGVNQGSFDRGERIANDNVDYIKADFKLTMHLTEEQTTEFTTPDGKLYVVLSSDEAKLRATMLESVSNLHIENGDILWNHANTNHIPDEATVLYQITVEYYNYDVAAMTPNGTQVFYTTGTRLDTLHILKVLDSKENYIIHVKTLVGTAGTAKDYDIATIENEYYKTDAVSYMQDIQEEGETISVPVYLLGSERQTLGGLTGENVILRADTVDTTPEDFKIVDGILYWKDKNALYEYVIVDELGNNIQGEFTTSETVVDGITVRSWTFEPYDSDKNPTLTYGTAHELTIYAYIPTKSTAKNAVSEVVGTAANTLKSYGSTFTITSAGGETSTAVYKLPTVENNDFTIEQFSEGGYGFNFEKLFADKTILSSQSYYAVRMMVTLKVLENGIVTEKTFGINDTVMTLKASDLNKRFEITLSSDPQFHYGVSVANDRKYSVTIYTNGVQGIELSFRTVDAQDTRSKMLLRGDLSARYNITPATWSENDAVKWDAENMEFSWTYGLENTVIQETELYILSDGELIDSHKSIQPGKDGYGKAIPSFVSLATGADNSVIISGRHYTKILWEGSPYYILTENINSREIDISDPTYQVTKNTPLYVVSSLVGEPVRVEQVNTIRLTQDAQGKLIPQQIALAGTGAFITVENTDGEGNVSKTRYYSITYQGQKFYICESDFEVAYGEKSGLYSITLTYHDGSKETCEMTEKYYQPKQMGTITKVTVFVRADEKSLYSTESIQIQNVNIEYKMFAGGDGSAANPYQITNETEFKNMKYRNAEGSKYYFIQKNDLTIDAEGFAIQDTFYGSYNGNGYTLNFNSMAPIAGKTLSQTFTSGVSTTNISFLQFSALFNELGSGSEFYNVKLNSQIAAIGITKNTMFAGIAITNYGHIHDNVIRTLNSNITFGQNSGLAFAYGGLTGVNYGKISDCTNQAMVEITPASTYNNQVLWAGITIANAALGTTYAGNLTRCLNSADLTITARKANNMIWLSGVTLNNTNGKITQCGNNGKLQAKDSGTGGAFTSFISGICLRTVNGEISYCYNNGLLVSGAGSQYVGGIGYTFASCSIAALVETSGTTIANTVTNIKNASNSYCYIAYATAGITISALTEKTIVCGDGKTLMITAQGDGFFASIH